jgi:hypothetical protein
MLRKRIRTVLSYATLLTAFATLFTTMSAALVQVPWVRAVKGGKYVSGNGDSTHPALTVCRSAFDGGQQVGKLWQNECAFEWGWQDHVNGVYEVLPADRNYHWVNPYRGTYGSGKGALPDNAVYGGNAGTQAGGAGLGVCQAYDKDDGYWHPGKFYAGYCNIAWGGVGTRVKKAKRRRTPDADGTVLVLTTASAAAPPPSSGGSNIVISVQGKPNNTIIVTGNGFRPNARVAIRVTNKDLPFVLIETINNQPIMSSASGTVSLTFSGLCKVRGPLYISANDGRSVPTTVDRTGTLWSNTAVITCT